MDVERETGVEAGTEAMQLDVQSPKTTVESSNLDLEQYSQQYAGRGKVFRLQFIAECCKSLRAEALRLAVEELKKDGCDGKFLRALCNELRELPGAAAMSIPTVKDIDNILFVSQSTREKLEGDLKEARINLDCRERLRDAYNSLGTHHYRSGDLENALKNFGKAQDYHAGNADAVRYHMNHIKVYVEQHKWPLVTLHAKKATALDIPALDRSLFQAVIGIANIEESDYKGAAKIFLDASFEHIDQLKELISARDVAIYGTLCALATLDRKTIKKKVIDSQTLKPFLDSAPEMREIVKCFYNSKYPQCLANLDKIKNDLLLDCHLSKHVTELYKMIRHCGQIQYFGPFLSADMHAMAAAFNCNVKQLETELIQLIGDGKIQARIDSEKKVLYARCVNQRTMTFNQAINVSKDYQVLGQALLIRATMTRKGLIVRHKD